MSERDELVGRARLWLSQMAKRYHHEGQCTNGPRSLCVSDQDHKNATALVESLCVEIERLRASTPEGSLREPDVWQVQIGDDDEPLGYCTEGEAEEAAAYERAALLEEWHYEHGEREPYNGPEVIVYPVWVGSPLKPSAGGIDGLIPQPDSLPTPAGGSPPTHDLEALREALIALNRNVGDLANSAVQAQVERALSQHVGGEG